MQIRNTLFTFMKMDGCLHRVCFSVESLMLKETLSRKGAVLRELIQLPYAYQYDNQIEVVVQYEVKEERDEAGFRLKMQPFKIMMN